MLLLVLLAGVLGALALLWPRLGRGVLPVALAAPVGITAWLLSQMTGVIQGGTQTSRHAWVPALDLAVALRLDGLSLLFALLIAGIGALIVSYAAGYFHGNPRGTRFQIYMLLFMASMLGVVLADNVLLLFVGWELTSFTSYLLIGFDHEKADSRKAALQALLVTGMGGLFLLGGVLLMGQVVGSMQLSEILASGDVLRAHPHYPWMLGLVLVGACTKSAQVPFHFWLPNAMAAPTPASAYLHSSTMVKAGVYLLARMQPALGGTEAWLFSVTGIGALTLLVGAGMAIGQVPLKRLLAYTTVAALGGMTMLVGLGVPAAPAAMAYLLAHALYKAALFMVAGVIDHETGEKAVDRLGGLRRAMPTTALAGVVAAVSMAGLPPAFGFVAKEAMLAGAGVHAVLPWIVVVSGALMIGVAYLTGVRPFVGTRQPTPREPHEAPRSMRVGPLVLSALALVFGLAPGHLDGLLGAAAGAVAGAAQHPHFALWHGWTRELALSLCTLMLGVGVVFAAPRARAWARALSPQAGALGPERGYAWALDGLNAFAGWQTRLLQSGSLRRYLQITMLTACLLAGLATAWGGLNLRLVPMQPVGVAQGALIFLVLVATAAAVVSPSRLGAVAAMGVVGFSVALLFIYGGAPDLAMTQLVVEALSVVLLVSAFYHLPPITVRSRRGSQWRDAVIALLVGGVMSVLTLAATQLQLVPPISSYYETTSVPLGHGRNIVNVILVDYRGLDTLGEITVLAVAALGAFALLKLRLGGGPARRRRGEDSCPL